MHDRYGHQTSEAATDPTLVSAQAISQPAPKMKNIDAHHHNCTFRVLERALLQSDITEAKFDGVEAAPNSWESHLCLIFPGRLITAAGNLRTLGESGIHGTQEGLEASNGYTSTKHAS